MSLSIDDLHKLVTEFKQKRIPSRIEAGSRMGAFIQDAFTKKGLVFPTTLCAIPVIVNEDLPPEIAHVRDQEDRLMSTFMFTDGEEGPKILCINHHKLQEHFENEFQRPLPITVERPAVSPFVGHISSLIANRLHVKVGPATLRLEPEGPRADDESEPREDQAG